MTVISCFHCERPVDTKKETLTMTISWLYDDLCKENNIVDNKHPPRVLGLCSKCWNNVFKNKPNLKDWYWEYNKNI